MIVFRADLSPQSGLRSLRRCAWLASLLEKKADVLLCCRESKAAAKFLAEKGIRFSLIRDPGTIDISEAGAIVFDVEPFSAQDAALLDRARTAGVKAVQFVPFAGQPQAADIVLAPGDEAQDVLLHHKFRHFNKARRKFRKRIRNIFVNLGDLLPYRDLRAVVETLHRLRYRMKIAPGLNLKKADKRNLMKIYPGVHFCGKSESPARAYFESDLALIPPGEEALEAACTGTPALYLALDKGREAQADSLAARGLGARIPSLADFSVQSLRDALVPLTLERREQMGAAGKALVDGLGVHRFLARLNELGIVKK
jgi:spore coat polysaccharide biosynthesis predicted glycosyltransferase SpsG